MSDLEKCFSSCLTSYDHLETQRIYDLFFQNLMKTIWFLWTFDIATVLVLPSQSTLNDLTYFPNVLQVASNLVYNSAGDLKEYSLLELLVSKRESVKAYLSLFSDDLTIPGIQVEKDFDSTMAIMRKIFALKTVLCIKRKIFERIAETTEKEFIRDIVTNLTTERAQAGSIVHPLNRSYRVRDLCGAIQNGYINETPNWVDKMSKTYQNDEMATEASINSGTR